MWGEALELLRNDPLKLDGRVDWVTKYRLIEEYRTRHELPLSHPQVSLLDLQYHDINRRRSVYYKLVEHGRTVELVDEERIKRSVDVPPQTTRARLRGEFIAAAKAHHRDYTVDWVHLKLNDQAQRTVMLKDPFASYDDRVERLIAGL